MYLGVGAVLGASSRYAISLWLENSRTGGLPLATFFINISGSLLLGILAGYLVRNALSPEFALFSMTGFCGSYTTFSTLSLETVGLLEKGAATAAIGYLGASMVLGPLLFFAGYKAILLLK